MKGTIRELLSTFPNPCFDSWQEPKMGGGGEDNIQIRQEFKS